MEAVLKEKDVVETYWNMLSALSRTVKLSLASRLTNSVLEEEVAEEKTQPHRTAKVKRRAHAILSDEELNARFSNLSQPIEPADDPLWQDVISANTGKTIKPIEKWL